MVEVGSAAGGAGRRGWRDWLGINTSTLALLGTILLVTAATELWAPLVPQYLKSLRDRAGTGDAWMILLVGLYGLYRDGLEAVNYYLGGAISGRFNTRRALLFFNFLPLVGLLLVWGWESEAAVFIAIPFVFAWDSIAGPATITVVADALPADRRTMAFSLQAIFRRGSKMLAYCISAALVWRFGEIQGVQAGAATALAFVVLAAAVQIRFMRTASRDAKMALDRPRRLLRQFSPDLRRLLAADVFARWAEGMSGPFIILYCVPLLHEDPGRGTALYASVLLNTQAIISIALYLLIGPLASREGLGKKPFIGLTFVFFAAFPVSLIVLGKTMGFVGLILAFVVGGLREIGEPARKAMVAELVPRDYRTQATGLYWSMRSLAVMWASPVGAVLWILGEWWSTGRGPILAFGSASLLGLVGVALFYRRFGR